MPVKKPIIYFDYAATTPVDPRVMKAMGPYFTAKFANGSSIHGLGQESANAVLKTRDIIANFLGCKANEVIFTSGATECNNTVLKGVAEALKNQGNHIITTQIEHPCILESCKYLENKGFKVTYLAVGRNGVIKISDVKKAVTKKTILVSIMYVNNEIGTIQPIAAVGYEIAQLKGHGQRIIFHTDAAQAVNYLDCRVDKLGVDLMSLSAHKIYGPKGVGALYIRKGTLIMPLMHGGHQEDGMRAGTLNHPGIAGFGKAISLQQNSKIREKENKRIKAMRDELIHGILRSVPNSKLNGDEKLRVPNNVNISFRGIEGESLLMLLDQEGIAISTGSACASGSLEPSHVLMALGRGPLEAHGSIRITLGRFTTKIEIKKLLAVLPKVVKKLRTISF